MLKGKPNATVMLLLLTTIFLVLVMAGIISWLILSQSRVNQHQVERAKAYYAAMGGMTIALDRMRTGAWSTGSTKKVCRYTNVSGDTLADCQARCDFCDFDIPYNVTITLQGSNPTAVNATVDYTYTP